VIGWAKTARSNIKRVNQTRINGSSSLGQFVAVKMSPLAATICRQCMWTRLVFQIANRSLNLYFMLQLRNIVLSILSYVCKLVICRLVNSVWHPLFAIWQKISTSDFVDVFVWQRNVTFVGWRLLTTSTCVRWMRGQQRKPRKNWMKMLKIDWTPLMHWGHGFSSSRTSLLTLVSQRSSFNYHSGL